MYLLFDVIYELVNISHIITKCNIGAGSGQKLGKTGNVIYGRPLW